WTCPHGHLHRELIGAKSLAREESERRRLERPCPARKPKPTRWLLTDVIDDYIKGTKARKRSWRDDGRHGNRWKDRFAGRTLDEISTGELERIRGERLETIKPATVNREFSFLRRIFNVAIRDGKTERNPIVRIGMLREPSGRIRYLSDQEEARLMAALADNRDRQRLEVLLHTGLRKS